MDKQRPPIRIDIAYALITLGSTTIWAVMSGWLLYFYLPPEGTPRVPATLYSAGIFIAHAVNVIIDPPIGYLSDYTHSRWGRRLPFMFAFALPMAVFFALLWMPPAQGKSIWNLIYLVVVLGFYNVAYSLLEIPYAALLPELALTDHHRVRISAWSASFLLIAMVLSGFAGLLIEHLGYMPAALIYAGATLPMFYLPFLVLRERPGRQIAVTERLNFWKSLSVTLHNRAFLVYNVTWALYWITTTFVQAAVPFIATEICLRTESDTMYFYIPAVLASLMCYPLVMWLSGRLGRWHVFSGSLLASAIVLPSLVLISDRLPVALETQGITWTVLVAIAASGAVVLLPTLAAEITDYDERLTGQRREGAYYAAWGVLDHVVNGAAAALLPLLLLLGRSRSDPHGPLGVQMTGVVGGVMMFVAFLVFLRYPLWHHEDSQRGAASQPTVRCASAVTMESLDSGKDDLAKGASVERAAMVCSEDGIKAT